MRQSIRSTRRELRRSENDQRMAVLAQAAMKAGVTASSLTKVAKAVSEASGVRMPGPKKQKWLLLERYIAGTVAKDSAARARPATGKAYSYVSLIGGSLERHTTWADCKRRVLGRSNARYKKTTSYEDEQSVLRKWNVRSSEAPRIITATSPTRGLGIPFEATDAFLSSFQWRSLRYDVLVERGRTCACCGRTPSSGKEVQVDHIKPRRLFPQLALVKSNLQVLCDDCNHGKANKTGPQHDFIHAIQAPTTGQLDREAAK